jgi:hypothetical protein
MFIFTIRDPKRYTKYKIIVKHKIELCATSW